MGSLSIKELSRRGTVPRFAYEKVAAKVLPGWDLSLAFVGPAKALALNKKLRNADYTPNVLSYEVGKKSGEILICLSVAEKQSAAYDMSKENFVLYLFIHGLLHLKGMAHGVTMETRERKLLGLFTKSPVRTHSSHVPAHSNRNRHRHLPSKNGGRRGTR
jgi:rRNA maturation RNase YbeY